MYVSLLYCSILCCLLFSEFSFVAFFLQYFDTVGWVLLTCKTVSHITYTVLLETLNTAQSINQSINHLQGTYVSSKLDFGTLWER